MEKSVLLRVATLAALAGAVSLVSGCGGRGGETARVVSQIEPSKPRRVEIDSRDATRLLVVEATGVASVWNIGRVTRPEKVTSIAAGAIDGHFYGKEGNIVTTGWDGTVCAWNADGKLLWETAGHDGPARVLAARPGADRVVSGGNDGTVRVWDLTGKAIGKPLGGHEGMVISVDLSPKGDTIASMDQLGTVRIFRQKADSTEFDVVEAFRKPNTLASMYAHLVRHDEQWGWDDSLSFSPLGNLLAAVGFDGNLRFFRLDGTAYGIVVSSPDKNHVRSVTFAPDGNSVGLATLGGNIQLVPINSTMPAPRHFYAHPNGAATSVAFSPLGDFLATAGSDNRVGIWRPHGQLIGELRRPPEVHTSAIAINAADPSIAVGDWKGTLQIWGMDGLPRSGRVRAHDSQVMSLSFSSRGDLLASSGGDKVLIWKTDLTPYTEPGGPYARGLKVLEFSPVSPHIAGAAPFDAVHFWPAFGFPRPEELSGLGDIEAIAHSADGTRLVAVDKAGQLRVWQTDGKPLSPVVKAHAGEFSRAVAFAPDGNSVATGAMDGTVARFTAEGTPIGKPFVAHSESVNAVRFSPEGQLVTGGADGVIRFWDVNSGKSVATINLGIAVDRIGYIGAKMWVQASTDYIYFFRPDHSLAATMVAYDGGMTAYTPDGKFSGESNGSNRPLLFGAGAIKLSPEEAYRNFSPSAVAEAITR